MKLSLVTFTAVAFFLVNFARAEPVRNSRHYLCGKRIHRRRDANARTSAGQFVSDHFQDGNFYTVFDPGPPPSDVPEPSSMVLLSTGIFGIVRALRQRYRSF